MSFFEFPHARTYSSDLGWLIKAMKEAQEAINAQNTTINEYNARVEAAEQLAEELRTFVNNYFDNLDVQQEINAKIDAMAADGSLLEILQEPIEQASADYVAQWLQEHITPTTPAVDSSMTVAGAAADAKAAGDAIRALQTDIDYLNDDLTIHALYDDRFTYNSTSYPTGDDGYGIGQLANDATITRVIHKSQAGVRPYLFVVRGSLESAVVREKIQLDAGTGSGYTVSNVNIQCKAGDYLFIGGVAGSINFMGTGGSLPLLQIPNAGANAVVQITSSTAQLAFNCAVIIQDVSAGYLEDRLESVEDALGLYTVYDDRFTYASTSYPGTNGYGIGQLERDTFISQIIHKTRAGVRPYLFVLRGSITSARVVEKVQLEAGVADGYTVSNVGINCLAGDYLFIGGAAGSINFMGSGGSLPLMEIGNPALNEYVSISTNTQQLAFNCAVIGSASLGSMPQEGRTFVVDISGNGDYTSFCEAVTEAVKTYGSTVIVRQGTYDIMAEMRALHGSDYFETLTDDRGLWLTNGIHIIGDFGAKLAGSYNGANSNVYSTFSLLNVQYDAAIENLQLYAKNLRYCIHDDLWDNPAPYKHVYKNVDMLIDNSGNGNWDRRLAFGGGLGQHGYVEFNDCIFGSVGLDGTAFSGWGECGFHNSPSAGAQSLVVLNNCYFKNGTFRFTYYGDSTLYSRAMVSGCSLKKAMELTNESASTRVNVEIVDCNNVVRA